MSGGFFRGTSAEQDTRFSNKQAKLLKTQKFPPELDHVVDITKVKMDVINPWIAKRVTELLGFEDEVLINFINGLLEGKDINGKQIQIQLTGFMEKHTGKFMKELWSLLISAQNNASGVPQQFLDAKEEETRKKKEELDRIGNEMQKRKEKEAEHVNLKMDGGAHDYSAAGPNSKFVPAKDSNGRSDDEKEAGIKNGFRRNSRSSRSPQPASRHPSPHRATSRAASKSYSNSRSYSGERNRSRKLSRSPVSISPERRRYHDESLSPRRRSPCLRRSMSRSRNRSVSPGRRRSRSPVWRRSRSPRRPWRRHRSPSRRRWSPSPRGRRSPAPWRHSPRRRHLSPSPQRRRSISPRRNLSPSPVTRYRRRSPSSSSSPPVRNRPSSPPRNGSLSPSPVKKRVLVLSSPSSHNQQHGSSSPQTQPSLSPSSPDLLQSPTDRYHHTIVVHRGRDSARDHNRREEKAYKRKSSQRSVSSPREENVINSSGEQRHYDNKSRKKEKDIRRGKTLEEPAAVLSPIDERKEDDGLLKLTKKDTIKCEALDSTDSEGKNTSSVTKKRKHRKSSRSESSGEDSERKEAKRRRKEEKKSRKDEKRRRRREERRRRKEEKRAHKRRSKDSDTTSSSSDKHENDVNAEAESEKKRVENELREKALQNIRAKKGISR